MNKKLKFITATALFSAMICVSIAFIPHIPTANGYIHIGDGIIYIGAILLPFPFGIIAASLGGGLADLLTGYPIYIIPTMLIKAMNALCFYTIKSNTSDKILTKKAVVAMVLSGIVTIVGYYVTAIILYGNPQAQLIETVPANSIQAIGSGILFVVIALSLDKFKLSKKFLVNFN